MLREVAKWGAKLGAKTLFKRGINGSLKALSSEIGKN